MKTKSTKRTKSPRYRYYLVDLLIESSSKLNVTRITRVHRSKKTLRTLKTIFPKHFGYNIEPISPRAARKIAQLWKAQTQLQKISKK